MSDKAPSSSSASASPNSCISSTLDTERDNDENRSRPKTDRGREAAGKAGEALSSSSFSDTSAPARRVAGEAEGATDDDGNGRRPAVAVAAVQSQLNHYARGLIMVQK